MSRARLGWPRTFDDDVMRIHYLSKSSTIAHRGTRNRRFDLHADIHAADDIALLLTAKVIG